MTIYANESGWILETATTAYTLGFHSDGRLAHGYWGTRLPYREDYPAPAAMPGWWRNFPYQGDIYEYPGYAGTSYVEPCLKVTFADGVRDVVLRREHEEVEGETLHITLRDAYYPLLVTLHYRIYAELDLLERQVTLRNEGSEPLLLERVFSAQWHLPHGLDFALTHAVGRWGDEFNLVREPLTRGSKVLESRRLTTSHHHQPWFALDRGEMPANEESGEVWFGVLAWSGNWKLIAETTEFASTRVSLGLNDWDFAWRLETGQEFVTPASLAGYTREGFGGASRRLHRYVRSYLLPHPELTRKVLYNSWEATTFAVSEEGQMALARHAAEMGVELFVMDDGWFHLRNSDNAGLGDWWPDPAKFPAGLTPLIEGVNGLGMDFGLWIEPEMVNPDSDLYRLHPDWVIHFPTRARSETRNQLILNVARRDVQEHLIELIDDLLSRHNIRFIKWDMNRHISEPGWPDAPGDQREIWVRYVQGLYHIWGTLRERHPDVIWQTCASGGGRVDFAILRFADQAWISDNTSGTARLSIQEGYSHIFPASTMEAWVTDWDQGRLPLEFLFHVSMCGLLGIGGNLLHWSEKDRSYAARLVAQYKDIRHLVQQGELYRLRSAQAHAFSGLMYVSQERDEAVLFAFRTHLPGFANLPLLYPRGLDPQARYTIEGYPGARSGQAWMQTGLHFELENFQSQVLRIRRT